MISFMELIRNKRHNVVMFSSVAIALYGYDQGMMSLINTNRSYLSTMGISEGHPLVGVIVSVYYLGCTVGAIAASTAADRFGRKTSIFVSLGLASLGNLLMFIAGLGQWFPKGGPSLAVMLIGRVVMGLGVGGIDAVIPVFSSELSKDEQRGRALAQEFQANILGLNIAFAINLGITNALGKDNQWAWRVPIIAMQAFSLTLMAIIQRLPESPRYFILHGKKDEAHDALKDLNTDEGDSKKQLEELIDTHEREDENVPSYLQMIFDRSNPQFHPTQLTIMAQVNQALTGYGAVSVYGPQIFELLGFGVKDAEYITQGNYISYLLLMTFAWLLMDTVGRRALMVWNSGGLIASFLLLTVFGGLAQHAGELHIPPMAVAIPGAIVLFVATGNFGIGWLAEVFLIPTEIYPTTARAKGTSISIITWGLANFAITLLTPILFNNLSYYLFLVFCATNAFAGAYTYLYQPECGGRSFEENQRFFALAREQGTWRVAKVADGEFARFPPATKGDGVDGETEPLLTRIGRQL